MAITDLQISDTLETSAPSIKYTGNEGPQAPQQMASAPDPMAELNLMYQNALQSGQIEPGTTLDQFKLLLEQSQAPQQGRRMAAGGGIMGSNNGSMLAARTADGSRPKYGFLDKIRKLIPNEIAEVAEKAAPFVAPFNPLAAGLMGGIGSFDRTGNLGGAFKSGLMNYGGGQLARGIGGGFGNLQTGFNPLNTGSMQGMGSGLTKYFSNPMQKTGGLGKFFGGDKTSAVNKGKDVFATGNETDELMNLGKLGGNEAKVGVNEALKKGTSGIMDFINSNSTAILLGSMGIAAATAKPQDMKEAVNATRGTKLDIDGIRAEVQEALAGGEEAWNELKRTKYPYMGEFPTKKAEGGRIGLYAGGVPSPYSMEDARKTSMQDKMGGITDVMKRADLFRSGDVGQMYMAEGGLMDMGGMEKDYRNDGGFVPIGGKEKADDVPARLSKNEFVFTADAVRGAGGGDIDKGAEMMENMMKNLEQGGQISEDSQGLGGAQEMFDVSERLGEVI